MVLVRRIARVMAALTAVMLYLWFAAVGYAPEIRRRKAARRMRRR